MINTLLQGGYILYNFYILIYKMVNNNYKLKIGTSFYPVEDIIRDGSTTSTNYVGFPNYNTSSLSFELHETAFGYKESTIDLANNIVALYIDYIGGGATNTGSEQNSSQANNDTYKAFNSYGDTITHASKSIPAWCTKMRVIVIGAGGGGGGAGAGNEGNAAGSGGGGGGGGFAAGTVVKTANVNEYSISLGGCGLGGYYEGTQGEDGYEARDPDNINTTFTYSNSVLEANCGEGGQGGAEAVAPNNASGTSSGGNAVVNATNITLLKETTIGNGGGSGNAENPGEGGTINFSANNYPALNTNQGNAPENMINQDNELPGYGQGGWGGLSTNNNNLNGYGGQCGGRSFVRVYFIR